MEFWHIALAALVVGGVPAFTIWAHRPTATDKAVYELGFNDGAEGRTPEKFDHPHNATTYREGYADGSRGRTRRADTEKLQRRQDGTK